MAIVSVILDESAESSPALESVLAQSFRDFEIIKAARNVGLSEARGKYVYFMDSEGMIFENALELLVSTADRTDAEIVHSSVYVEREGEKVEIVPIENDSKASLNLYRRDFLERTGLKFPQSIEGDEAFCYAASCLTDRIERIGEYFYVGTRRADRSDSDQIYVRDIHKDEVRSGFLVTSQRKKLWNAQIKLIREFDRICRKYNLSWFANAGTQLGTARHKGFIPWDDDIDLVMLRPDYMKFKQVAPSELKPQYFLDEWYNYALEGEPNPEQLPVVSAELFEEIQRRNWYWPTNADFIKLRDSSTTMIQWPERRNVHQGIWIDIFSFDPVPPFEDKQHYINFEIKKELMMAVSYPNIVRAAMKNGETLLIDYEKLEHLLSLPFKQRAIAYEEYVGQTFFDSKYVTRIAKFFTREETHILLKHSMRSTIEMPFEESNIRMPIGYDDLLSTMYGEWRDLIFSVNHMKAASTDISYRKFFEQVSPAIKEFNF